MGIQKAIAALITNGLILLAAWGINIEVAPEMIASISMILSTIVVWAIPNK